MGGEGTPRSDLGPILLGWFAWMPCLTVAICALIVLAYLLGVRFEKAPTADELYGCTPAQQAPNGECQ